MQVTEVLANGGRGVVFQGGLEATVNAAGAVLWCSAWGRIGEAVASGEVIRHTSGRRSEYIVNERTVAKNFPCAGCGGAKHSGPCGGGRYEV